MKISLCLIVKNEEKVIKRCIMSSKHLVDEIVIVDTGSTDSTVSIAEEMGAKVYYFEWVNDFSQARNYAIERCTGEWIVFLDADEYLGEVSKRELLKKLKHASKYQADALIGELINLEEATGNFQSVIKTVRIFKRLQNIRYKGAIHEKIYHKTRELRFWDVSELIKVFHTGYSREDVENKEKGKRNLDLLFNELDKNPNNSDIYFYIVESLLLNNETENVLEYTYKVEECNNGTIMGINQKNRLHRLNAMIAMKKEETQILEEYKKALGVDDTYPDYEYAMAEYYIGENSIDKAIEYINRTIEKMNRYSSMIESWIVPKAQGVFMVLGNLYLLKGDKPQAVRILINILREDKYQYDSLFKLVTVLDESEKAKDIFDLLIKLYDVNQLKDKLYLIKATKNMKKQFVHQMMYELLSEEEKMYMNNI